jgi:predicted  nucleic acid-binding Zn-ribbon protein
MKIKKFNEAFDDEILDISSEKVSEMIEALTNSASNINKEKEKINSIYDELSNFRSKSKDKNDQIDDSVSNLELIRSKIAEIIDLIDNVNTELNNYNENGRKYLY